MNLYSIFLKNLQIEKKIITENREYSYGQIFNFIENTSSIIEKYKQNTRIFLVSNNFFSYLILFYVCSKLGKTLIPVNSTLSKNQILSICEFVKPNIVVFSNEYSFFKRHIKSDKLILDNNFYQETDKKLTNIINEIKLSKKYINNDYIVTFSSGTTSLPKPILYTQKIKYNRYLHIKNLYKIKQEDNILLTSPVDHSLGQRILFLSTLTGCNLIYLKKYNKKLFKKFIRNEKISFSILSSNYVNLMKNELLKKKIKIKKIVSAASTLSLKDKLDFKKKKINLYEMYGAAEIGTITNLSIDNVKKANSVGRILQNCKVKIFDKNSKILKHNQIGEIACKTNLILKEYYKSKNLTKKSFVQNYFLTGDFGYKDSDNFLYFVSRKKDVIISSGENIYPLDIEKEVLRYNNISECCAIGIPDKYFGEAVFLVCVTKKKDKEIEKKLRNFLRTRLANFQQPLGYDFVTELPKNRMGKIVKREVKKIYLKKKLDLSKQIRKFLN
jgi:acyl-coenzyme A synthetase/AMP-(fatty) acid ligase